MKKVLEAALWLSFAMLMFFIELGFLMDHPN